MARERRDDSWAVPRPDSRTEAAYSGSTRVGDGEREQVILLLADAFADGRLTREEFDARSAQALEARTGDDLGSLTADLPRGWVADRRRARRDAGSTERSAGTTGWLRAEIRPYLGIVLVLVAVWLVVGLTAHAWYPWFVWPALGWGIAIVARRRGTARRAAQRSAGAA